MTYTAVLPILGFNDVTLYELENVDGVFYRLKNKEEEAPAFMLITPNAIRNDYVFEIPDEAAEKLGLTEETVPLTLNIMILDTTLEKSHVNFLAPLLFNPDNGKMGQVVLDSSKYPNFGVAEPLENYIRKETDLCD